jgi:hypothetical protein
MAWRSIHDWLNANSQNNLFGVIVGGAIGIIGGFIIPTCGTVGRWWTGKKQIKARLTALAVELDYLRETIIEIREVFANGSISSKRLNVDLLESVRLTGYELSSIEDFIKALAQVYRDVVHTNDRLDDILSSPSPLVERVHDVQALLAHERTMRAYVARLSLEGAERSIENLRGKINVKTSAKFTRLGPPMPEEQSAEAPQQEIARDNNKK